MTDLTIYEKRTCSTCRKLSALLDERGIEAEHVQYHVEGIDEPTIRSLLAKAGIGPRDALSSFPAHWDPKLRIPRGQVVAAASIVSPKY